MKGFRPPWQTKVSEERTQVIRLRLNGDLRIWLCEGWRLWRCPGGPGSAFLQLSRSIGAGIKGSFVKPIFGQFAANSVKLDISYVL